MIADSKKLTDLLAAALAPKATTATKAAFIEAAGLNGYADVSAMLTSIALIRGERNRGRVEYDKGDRPSWLRSLTAEQLDGLADMIAWAG